MTEKLISRQALHRASRDLRLAYEALEGAVELMKKDNVPHLPLHGENYTDKLVPQVAKWATKLEGQVKLAIPMYLDGLESAEEEQKDQASAGAKGPAKRKA